MTPIEERLSVIENIRHALKTADTFAKVELSDPNVTDEDVRRVILPFDLLREKPRNKIKAYFARKLAEGLTKKFNSETELFGVENALSVKGGAFVTSNHYNPTDSTPIRLMAYQMGKRKQLNIVVQTTNIFMNGLFGFLMKNANTVPVCGIPEYTARRLTPALEKMILRGDLVLVYPEQEMWFNYRKPRPSRDGVYHWAAKLGAPIIPTFTEMRNMEGERDENGFLPVKHILHIMPPIYPNPELSVRENRVQMQNKDDELRRMKYEEVYGIPLDDEFIAERDIAGFKA